MIEGKEPKGGVAEMSKWIGTPGGLLGLYLLGINLAALIAMGWDKHRSKQPGRRRIPEKRLFLLSLLGGALGGTAGMLLFHHKTRHWYFRLGFPAILVMETALGLWLALR